MATFTSRTSLRKPATSDAVNVGTDLNNNLDKLDTHLGYYICTSATRPTGTDRFIGRTIFETDTQLVAVWADPGGGAQWNYLNGMLQSTWSFSLTGATSGTFTLGNGTVSANYFRSGQWVDMWVRFTLGSTTSFASVLGTFNFNLPVPTTMGNGTVVGYGEMTDSSTADRFTPVVMVEDANNVSLTITKTASGKVTNSNPWSWANGDTIRYSGRYKVT